MARSTGVDCVEAVPSVAVTPLLSLLWLDLQVLTVEAVPSVAVTPLLSLLCLDLQVLTV